jgi:hypothetical protein
MDNWNRRYWISEYGDKTVLSSSSLWPTWINLKNLLQDKGHHSQLSYAHTDLREYTVVSWRKMCRMKKMQRSIPLPLSVAKVKELIGKPLSSTLISSYTLPPYSSNTTCCLLWTIYVNGLSFLFLGLISGLICLDSMSVFCVTCF